MTWYGNSEGRYGERGKKGDIGESIFEQYCISRGISFTKLTDRHSQVVLKCDYMLENKLVDVKANFFRGQACVELFLKKKGPGWIFTTKAEEIYCVDIDKKDIYRYNVNEMKTYAMHYKQYATKTKRGDVIMWVPVSLSFITKLTSEENNYDKSNSNIS